MKLTLDVKKAKKLMTQNTVPPYYFQHGRWYKWFNKEFALTKYQEFWCWRFALHGNKRLAVRESHKVDPNKGGYISARAIRMCRNPRIVLRVVDLLKKHHEGILDLTEGPWSYYNDYDFGNINAKSERTCTLLTAPVFDEEFYA